MQILRLLKIHMTISTPAPQSVRERAEALVPSLRQVRETAPVTCPIAFGAAGTITTCYFAGGATTTGAQLGWLLFGGPALVGSFVLLGILVGNAVKPKN